MKSLVIVLGLMALAIAVFGILYVLCDKIWYNKVASNLEDDEETPKFI
jgi:hypothetical protein